MKRRAVEGGEVAAGWCSVFWVGTWLVVASLAGCGGGGAGGASSGGTPPMGDPPLTGGTGSIRVKVIDFAGEAVAGTEVWVSATNSSALTGQDGIVRFDNVAAGTSRVCASHPVRGHSCSAPDPVTVEKGKVLELSLQLKQLSTSAAVAAVLSATAEPGGVSADGRSMDLTLRVAVIGPQHQGSWFVNGDDWGYNRLQVFGCTARAGDELAQLGPRCIRRADGSDASYSFAKVNDLGPVKTIERPGAPWAAGLLIDQSDAGLSPNWLPNDARIFAAKRFADRLLPATPLLLGAFANDEPSGSASRLPQRPVTFFPVESPAFLTGRAEAFGVLNHLHSLVGGGAPLYEAIVEAVDYMAARTPPERSRALVVLADGADTNCGTPAQCAALRKDVIDRARAAAVQLFLVGGTASDCTPDWVGWEGCDGPSDREAIQLLAREGGFPIVIGNAPDLGPAMELAGQWLQPSMTVQDISLRLTSDSEGAFAPGATVMGAFTGANASQCPMGCQVHQFVFSVEVLR